MIPTFVKSALFGVLAFSLPLLAYAEGGGSGPSGGGFTRDLQGTGRFLIYLIDTVLVPLIFAVAFIVFIWGIAKYFVMGGANPESREEGQKLMLYGIIGFFVMISIWGIVNVFVNTFGFNREARPGIPQFNGPPLR